MSDQNASAAELRRKYLKEWRKKHPEKVKEYNLLYWERKAQRASSSKITDAMTESEEE